MTDKEFSSGMEQTPSRLQLFSSASAKMVNTNTINYANLRSRHTRVYTEEDVEGVINSDDINKQRALSRNQFNSNGYYKQIVLHYANFLKYSGVLIPKTKNVDLKSNSKFTKKYYGALEYLELMQIPTIFSDITLKILVDGGYYGVRADTADGRF